MKIADVFPKVCEIIADVLVIDEADITLDKRLIADLGAESIDFLDLVFQLEKEFSIKIPRGQLEKDARGNLSEAQFEHNGIVSEAGIIALKNHFDESPAENFKSQMKVNEIPELFSVHTFCKLIVNAKQKEAEAVA